MSLPLVVYLVAVFAYALIAAAVSLWRVSKGYFSKCPFWHFWNPSSGAMGSLIFGAINLIAVVIITLIAR